MQSIRTDLGIICNLYKSLSEYVQGLRERFDYYEMKGMELCKIKVADYDLDSKRTRKRKIFHDESKNDNDTCSTYRLDGIVNKFYPIIDNISSELTNRSKIYFDQNEVFGFIYKLFTLANEEIREKASVFAQKYPADLTSDLGEEFVHFKVFIEALDLNTRVIQMKTLKVP